MARRRGITCPPPLRTGSPARKNSVMICGGFIGGAGPQEPLPLEDQTFVEITKCCDDTTGDGVGDTTFFKILIVDGTGATQSSSVVDGAGAPYTPISEVPCGIQTDLETIEACYQDITDPTIRYTRVTLVDVTNQEVDGVIWLDDSGMSIAEPDAATIEPCVSAEYTDVKTRCKCDDVNEDGSEYVDYVEAFKIDCTGGVITSTLIGTFTDSTMSEAYTPVSPIDCDDVGDDACLREFVMCDDGTSFVRVVDILSGTKIIDYTGEFEAYTVTGTPTLGACAVKQTVEVEDCEGNQVEASVDQEVAIRGVVTVKQCPAVPIPVIEIDVEFVCNTETNVYDQIVTTTTDGVPVIAAPVPTTTSCDEDKPDWEVYDMCDLITSTRHTVTVMFETSGQTEISNIDTGVPCVVPIPECVESQEWTYGIDNTGTRFNDVAEYEITLSDGSVLKFSQNGSSGSWTPQLIEWANNIQAAADAAGLAWFVEPRFIDDTNPANIDGTIGGPGGTPSGLPGAPSIPVATALSDGGMSWRYVNIQICPGQPVPVNAIRTTSQQFTNNPFTLTTAGAVLGPIQKFIICRECGKEAIWYLEDGVTLASAGQIPNCYEPCGTLALTDAPPDRDCTFQTELACDNNNSTITADFTPDITRRATICNGEQIAVDYFQADPADPSALIPYEIVGRFVDCATGEEIVLPELPCVDLMPMGKSRCYQTEGGTEGEMASIGTACQFYSPDSCAYVWKDEITGEVIDPELLIDCPVETAIAVIESCDGTLMYGIGHNGDVVWEKPNPSAKVAEEVKG